MYNKLKKWEFYGVFAIFGLFSLLHFGYELTQIKFLAYICAVNESVWEHAKIGFYAALIFGIIEYFFIDRRLQNFIVAKALSTHFMPIFVIVTYYTYTGIFGKHYLWVDILIAFLAGVLSQVISYSVIRAKEDFSRYNILGILWILGSIFLFSIFTVDPPKLPLFYDRSGNKYGI